MQLYRKDLTLKKRVRNLGIKIKFAIKFKRTTYLLTVSVNFQGFPLEERKNRRGLEYCRIMNVAETLVELY